MKTKLIAVFALTFAIAASTGGVASARASHAKANLKQGAHNCGAAEPTLPVVGIATLKRVGNVVTVKVVMKHGEPNATYQTQLFGNATFCEFLGTVFNFTTNRKGVGKGSGSFTVPPGNTEFFVDPFNEAAFVSNDTQYVKLP